MLKQIINFLPWSGKASLEIEIPDDTEERFRLRVALEIAAKAGNSLSYASLDGARLDGASLDGARLDGASLDGASLDGASLVRASLDGASLDGARLDGASLRSIRTDFFDVLLRARNEIPALLGTLRAGKVDGSVYQGECACLVGTIANARQVHYFDLGAGLEPDGGRPAERWFLGINKGDTPATNQIAKITEGWIVEFMELTGMPVPEAPLPTETSDAA